MATSHHSSRRGRLPARLAVLFLLAAGVLARAVVAGGTGGGGGAGAGGGPGSTDVVGASKPKTSTSTPP
jgi:hypothetical protein